MTKKITIITTRQNFKWISMQEVLPLVEQCWSETADLNSFEYRLINIDENPLRSFMNFLMQSDAIVIIAFNETIAKFMKEVRVRLQLPIPFIFHLHGLATIALWPLEHFQIMDSLTEGDAFIGTCEGDRKCLNLIFERCSFYRIPYPFYPLALESSRESSLVFAYVGRLSDQKNIHCLISAYENLYREDQNIPPFYIYGAEDFLGSPNMGISSSECLVYLKNLIADYKLEEKIIFKGFKIREEIFSELGSNHIALSASTHSDENFGMAVFRSLSLGAQAVLTHWGGHIHFKEEFPDSIITVPVLKNESTPAPSVEDLKKAMVLSLKNFKVRQLSLEQKVTNYFTSNELCRQYHEIVENVHMSDQQLKVREPIKNLFHQKAQFTKDGQIQRIYQSYQDPQALNFFNAYK